MGIPMGYGYQGNWPAYGSCACRATWVMPPQSHIRFRCVPVVTPGQWPVPSASLWGQGHKPRSTPYTSLPLMCDCSGLAGSGSAGHGRKLPPDPLLGKSKGSWFGRKIALWPSWVSPAGALGAVAKVGNFTGEGSGSAAALGCGCSQWPRGERRLPFGAVAPCRVAVATGLLGRSSGTWQLPWHRWASERRLPLGSSSSVHYHQSIEVSIRQATNYKGWQLFEISR